MCDNGHKERKSEILMTRPRRKIQKTNASPNNMWKAPPTKRNKTSTESHNME